MRGSPRPRGAGACASSRWWGARASPDGIAASLRALIAAHGPITVAAWMERCNAHYYATRDPFGARGDFITAPEISQMFGELIGLWGADLRARAGAADAVWVELGPGRGTLAADASRAMARAGWRPEVHFVETSPVLRAAQAERVPGATWHETVATLPRDRPLVIVANEFVDALPVRQFERTAAGWRERRVHLDEDGFAVTADGDAAALGGAPTGSIAETCPAGVEIVGTLAARLAAQGGALLLIDYGHGEPQLGDTLQAVRGHAFADPYADPGAADLTAHVDFAALAAAARTGGCSVHGPTTQGAFLEALGLGPRAAALARASPARAGEIEAARARLAAPEAMGRLFKVLAAVAPSWPPPAALG